MAAPPPFLERLVGLIVPPACREEVVGDLHERYASLPQYIAEALVTVPLVIVSRIRRTTDFQVLLMEAFAAFLAFWGAARLIDAAFLEDRLAWLRLASPAATALAAMVLEDAYARPGRRAPMKT